MGLLSRFRKIMPALTKTNTKAKISSPESQSVGMASSVLGWASLPTDLLESVLDRIVDFFDFIRFCSICKAWRFIALQPPHQLDSHSQSNRLRLQHQRNFHLLKTCRNKLPMILTIYHPPTHKDNNRQEEDHWRLYSVTEGNSYDIQLSIPYSQQLFASSSGWLLTIDDHSMVITLINPFLSKKFSLPPCDVIPLCVHVDFSPGKAVLLFDPGQVNYKVFFTLTGNLAYFTSKTQTWVRIKTPPLVFSSSDIISYKGRLYTVSSYGMLMHVDVSRSCCTIVASVADSKFHAHKNRLVESQEGDLLLVRFFIYNMGSQAETTVHIEVYKLLLPKTQQRRVKWARIYGIGEQALVLGDNKYGSISVSTRDFPMCKPNCIYYADRYYAISKKMPQKGEICVRSPGPYPDSGSAIWIVPYFKA